MSTKYKFIDKQDIYHSTSTVVEWLEVFTRDVYKDILLDSLRFCQKNQGLSVHACLPDSVIQVGVLMTNPNRHRSI